MSYFSQNILAILVRALATFTALSFGIIKVYPSFSLHPLKSSYRFLHYMRPVVVMASASSEVEPQQAEVLADD